MIRTPFFLKELIEINKKGMIALSHFTILVYNFDTTFILPYNGCINHLTHSVAEMQCVVKFGNHLNKIMCTVII